MTGFVRDRSSYRVVDNWEQKLGQAVPVADDDAKMVGAKFAMYCIPAEDLITVMEKIVLNENSRVSPRLFKMFVVANSSANSKAPVEKAGSLASLILHVAVVCFKV